MKEARLPRFRHRKAGRRRLARKSSSTNTWAVSLCLPAALAGTQYGVLTFLAEKGIDETALLAGTIADEGKWLCIIPRKRVHA